MDIDDEYDEAVASRYNWASCEEGTEQNETDVGFYNIF